MNSSIKRKVMYLLSITSFISSSVFLLYSINIFRKDKIAYIYDSNNIYLETITNQIKNEIKLSSEISKRFLLDFQKNKRFKMTTDEFLPDDSYIKGLVLIDVTSEPKIIDQLTTNDFKNYKPLEDRSFIKNLNTTKVNGKSIYFDENNIFITDLVFDQNEKIILISFFKSEAIASFLNDDKSFLSFIMNLDKEVSRQTKNLEPQFLEKNFPILFKNIEKIKIGTSEIEDANGVDWLLSSSNIGIGDSYIVTLTNKSQAFGVLAYLLNKSLIVFAMVFIGIFMVSLISSKFITQRILNLYEAAQQISSGNFKVNVEVNGHDEISLLSKTFNNMAIEIVKLLDETAQKARIESELKTAQAVQKTLFPENYHKFDCAEIQGSYQSASECGGDWWHYFENKSSIWFWMADATGHGAPAALITSAIKSAVSMTEYLNMTPQVAIEMVNKSICQVSNNEMMMTCFLGVIDKKTKILQYVNASHEVPFILKKGHQQKKKDLVFLDETKSNRLGQSLSSDYYVAQYQLHTGDRIFVYTDGIPDIHNKNNEILQERGLYKVVLENHNKSQLVSDFIIGIQSQLNAFRENSELIDDVTFFALDIQ